MSLNICQVLLSRSIKSKKKKRGQYSAILTSRLVNKGFIILPERKLLLAGPTREIASGQDAWVANQNARFGPSCPLADSAIY